MSGRVVPGLLTLVWGVAALAEIPLRIGLERASTGELVAAEHDLRLAQSLRPWDGEIAASAAHIYATLAATGVSGVTVSGGSWSKAALVAFPHSPQTLEDAAGLALARGDTSRAYVLLARAAALDPANPELLIQAGVVAGRLHRYTAAVGLLRKAVAITPNSALARQALAAVYRVRGEQISPKHAVPEADRGG